MGGQLKYRSWGFTVAVRRHVCAMQAESRVPGGGQAFPGLSGAHT